MKPLTIYDIESILLNKNTSNLTAEEWRLLLTHLENREQVMAYKEMLLMSSELMKPNETPELAPRKSIQQQVRLRMKPQKTYKSGLGYSIIAAISALPNPLKFGVCSMLFALFFWFNLNVNNLHIHPNQNANDSLTMNNFIDTVAVLKRDVIKLTKYTAHNVAYISNPGEGTLMHINGILRYY